MLHFPDPLKLKTKRVVFEDIFSASDPGTLEELKELSSTRRSIEESMNDRSIITKAVAREMSGGSTLQREQCVECGKILVRVSPIRKKKLAILTSLFRSSNH